MGIKSNGRMLIITTAMLATLLIAIMIWSPQLVRLYFQMNDDYPLWTRVGIPALVLFALFMARVCAIKIVRSSPEES